MELGRLIGVSEPAINRYERGNRKPPREKMNDIAKALNVPLKDLFVNLVTEDEEKPGLGTGNGGQQLRDRGSEARTAVS